MRTDLDEDPAVVGVATALKVPETQVIGWLWKLWSVASRQTDNGWLPHFTPQKIDGIVGHQGFSAALEAVAWLLPRSGGVVLPNFERWLSNSAKKRFKDTQRKRNVRKMSALEADKNGTPVMLCPLKDEGDFNEGAGEKENAPVRAIFCKPTLEQVAAYCVQRGNSVDPESFVNFYESKGWMIGKNSMKNWQAAVRTWEKHAFQNGNGHASNPYSGIEEWLKRHS